MKAIHGSGRDNIDQIVSEDDYVYTNLEDILNSASPDLWQQPSPDGGFVFRNDLANFASINTDPALIRIRNMVDMVGSPS